ncbi:AAA family ATPase [Marinobacterium rhizophilum]|uniref:AAA family ATPase n=1 Tax=Marinobacterium rhizophilum TaxID=420402 RepID=A0ABY5HPR8_9GAMM|nr:AAA family ATPase [Marinobacterium rhizophilum]UTW13548.1 AAA family ATPase [Marinobacterium rhizophilum]
MCPALLPARRYFTFRSVNSPDVLGDIAVRGMREPVGIFEVLGAGALRTRLQVAASRGLTHFFGRQMELERLHQALQRALAGQGQVVALAGEPGVGKSRLFYEFKRHCPPGCRVLETFSVSHGKAFAYLPLIELLNSQLQIAPQDDERQRRDKLIGWILGLELALDQHLPYLLHLLGIVEAAPAVQQMDPLVRRQRTLEALQRLFVHEASRQPLVMVFEDLQWLDTETLAFLEGLVGAVSGARILLLVNFRPEYQPGWRASRYCTLLRLEPLREAEATQLLDTLLGDDASLTALKSRIMAQTEGNPFFLEEVVQGFVEEKVLRGTRSHYRLEQAPAGLRIPATVQGVLSARIDRLAPADKALLQILAVIGKTFTWSLVLQVADSPADELHRQLARLQNGEYLYARPALAQVEYSFKHALTQEVAYGTLLTHQRKGLHERTAQAIETLFEGHLDDHCSTLAYHYRLSLNLPKALEYLQRAARQAAQRSANSEAVQHCQQALQLLQQLPQGAERDSTELDLQLALGPSLMAVRGFAASEVGQTYRRALALQRQVGRSTDLFFILAGLRIHYLVRAEHRMAQALGEQLLQLAEQLQDHDLQLEAHCAMGSVFFFLGRFSDVRCHVEKAIALYAPERHSFHATHYGLDPGVSSRYQLALVLQLMGEGKLAQRWMDQALALAHKLAQPFSRVAALCFAAEWHRLRRDAPQAQACAQASIELAREQGFMLWSGYGMVLCGWARARQAAPDTGIELIRAGIAAFRATEARLYDAHFQTLLAEALAIKGDFEQAQRVLAQAEVAVSRQQEPVFDAQLFCLKADVLTRLASTPARYAGQARVIEANLRRAARIARGQGARLLELRAACPLSRCLHRQQRFDEARQVLVDICDCFPVNADFDELRAARALLAQLA